MLRPQLLSVSESNGEITPAEIKEAYSATFKVSWWKKWLSIYGLGVFHLTNLNYNKLNWDEVAEIIAIDQTEQMEWVYANKKYTCADFAYSLMGVFHKYATTAGMPIFITWVAMPEGGHGVLSFYYKGKVYVIEPQTDEIFDVPPDWRLRLLNG